MMLFFHSWLTSKFDILLSICIIKRGLQNRATTSDKILAKPLIVLEFMNSWLLFTIFYVSISIHASLGGSSFVLLHILVSVLKRLLNRLFQKFKLLYMYSFSHQTSGKL